MNTPMVDKVVAWSVTGVVLAAFLWLWGEAPGVALWPVLSATAAMVAAMVLWTDVVPGNPQHGWWALAGGLALTAELLLEYALLPSAAWLGQTVAWLLVAALAGIAAWRDRGSWRTGLRAGLGAASVALIGQTLVFGIWLGHPEQATVLEAQGIVARFEASHATSFRAWSVGAHWSDKALVLALGAGLGLAAGWLGGLLRRPPTRAGSV